MSLAPRDSDPELAKELVVAIVAGPAHAAAGRRARGVAQRPRHARRSRPSAPAASLRRDKPFGASDVMKQLKAKRARASMSPRPLGLGI